MSINFKYLQSEKDEMKSELDFTKRRYENIILENEKLTDDYNRLQDELVRTNEEHRNALSRSAAEQKSIYEAELQKLDDENKNLRSQIQRLNE